MKFHSKVSTLMLVLALGAVTAVWARQGTAPSAQSPSTSSSGSMQASQSPVAGAPSKEASAKPPAVKELSGTVTSMTDTQLVLGRKVKGKSEETTFVLNAATKKHGNLKAGVRVAVYYQAENDQNIATAVRVYPTRSTSAAKPSPKKS